MSERCSHPQCWCNNVRQSAQEAAMSGAQLGQRVDAQAYGAVHLGQINVGCDPPGTAKSTVGVHPNHICGPRCPGDAPDDALTFAEAMALDPSEVEAQYTDTTSPETWPALTCFGFLSAWDLKKHCRFRRSRHKRSRVEEMANTMFRTMGSHEHYIAQKAATEAIRAVCEHMRPRSPAWTADVEREFLEPR